MSFQSAKIKSFREGEQVAGFYLVREVYRRYTRNTNSLFLDITLMDSTGMIPAKFWEAEQLQEDIIPGMIVGITGRVETFGEILQLNLQRIVSIDASKQKDFRWEDVLPTTDQDVEAMWKEVQDVIRGITNPYLQQLVSIIYDHNEEDFKMYPASMVLHHAVVGGFLTHIYSMMKLSVAISEHYQVDKDLLVAGVFLHDIGKIRELTPPPQFNYTEEGNFLGHISIGYEMTLKVISSIDNFPEILKMKILHMVLSHQGKYEWQSPKQPKFIEAYLLHIIDEMDVRTDQIKRIIKEDKTPGDWTSKYNYFRHVFYKGSEENDNLS
jgi:3'-5' exoribonuclease